MKNKLIILTAFLTVVVFSCENALNKEPNFISEEIIFEDENIVEAFLAEIYNSIPFQIMTGQANHGMGNVGAIGGEYTAFANWQQPNKMVSRTYSPDNGAGDFTYWPYSDIREINYFIENITTSATLSQNYTDTKLGEARFLRAFIYFEMVKRYGGVPLITKVQNESDPKEELYPPRNTEKEVYDFIYSETSEILNFFPDTKTGVLGRVDKFTVLALQSRAMLYAASIAKFGAVQLDGLVGIPASNASTYYKRSYDASQTIIDAGYELYNKSSDKVDNFIQLFLDEGNNEVIFSLVYEPFIKAHSLDNLSTPQGFKASWNSNFPVFYDIVEEFGFVEGSALSNISRDQLTEANTWDINEFFGERDPRFRASVFYPEYEWQGRKAYYHTSTTYTDSNGDIQTINNRNTILDRNGEDWPAAAPPRNVRNTALMLRKRLNESNNSPIGGSSGQDYYIFRLGEILLNHAEAAFYLPSVDNQIAINDLNALRNRAGMPTLTEVTQDNIRNERAVELAFEDHRYWDLVRWRIASDKFDGTRMRGLIFKYNLDTNRYTITLKNGESWVRSYGEERYYMPLNRDWIIDNPNLRQNPNYNN